MRRFLFLFLFLPFMASAQDADCAMKFTATEHNFGRVSERGKAVSHTFEFTNEGTHPLVITRMTTTCKCTSYEFPGKPVPPGGKGKVTITYNPRRQGGTFYRVVQLFTNCERGRMMLTIRGEVTRDE